MYNIPRLAPTDGEILAAKRGEIDWRSLIIREDDDLLGTASTAPGRPRTFLLNPELGTAPFSCELICYDNLLDMGLLIPVSRFLRCGAGVKVNLDDYVPRSPAKPDFNWRFRLSEKHEDYHKLSVEQKEYLISDRDFEPGGVFFEKSPQLIMVEDSMSMDKSIGRGTYSIEDSWSEMIYAAEKNIPVIIDLSPLRCHGTVNHRGLMASGPIGLGKYESKKDEACSFFSIYQRLADYLINPDLQSLLILLGTLNDTLRRGGFKRGIVTTAMDWRNPCFEEYLAVPLQNLPGGHKKGARITEEILAPQYEELRKTIVKKRNQESLFLAKVKPNFYDNVCMGLGIVNYGTCLIWRLNLGKVELMSDLPGWMKLVASQLMLLHLNWRQELPEIAKIAAPQNRDLQIGLDIMGLANALAYWGIDYYSFNQSLIKYNTSPGSFTDDCVYPDLLPTSDQLVYWLAEAYKASTRECDRICDLYQTPRMLRIHTASEPAQSHSYETTDLRGFTTCRAIFPPLGKLTRKRGVRVRRVSNHQKNVKAYHGFVEPAIKVTPELHQEVCFNFNAFVKLVGRSHEYMSFDDYREMTLERFEEFILDPRIDSFYYQEHKNYAQTYLSKSAPSLGSLMPDSCSLDAYDLGDRSGECAVCAE